MQVTRNLFAIAKFLFNTEAAFKLQTSSMLVDTWINLIGLPYTLGLFSSLPKSYLDMSAFVGLFITNLIKCDMMCTFQGK